MFSSRAAGGGVGSVGSKLFQAVTPGPGARIAIRITGGDSSAPQFAGGGPNGGGRRGGGGGPGGPGGQGPNAEGDSTAGGNPVNAIINAIAGGGGGGGGGGGFGGGAPGGRAPGDTVRI